MNEQKKIKEAEFSLKRMNKEKDDRKSFEYNLSAFLSAARSVMQYAFEEVKKARTKEMRWYENSMSSSALLQYFKCKHDTNIHKKIIKPRAEISTTIIETVSVGAPKKKTESQQETKVSYEFWDWSGEDVLSLCQRYIQELKKVIKEGKSKGFLV